ncbi:MAG: TerC family protein [Verrucomicrobiota bacterium]|nr:TerC family protein [Verrucomicrobiota bacterium]MEE2812997.1 TerC family protein [Verrucomicrobiota bacterium]
MEWISTPEAWIALLTLTALEIVLGIDNIIFISILVDRLPDHQQKKARLIGLGLAMVMRILLLLSLSWVMDLKDTLFAVMNHEVSGRDLILLGGGLFLIWKSTQEIHHSLTGKKEEDQSNTTVTYGSVLAQIAILDIVFSLDSVITAVGMAKDIPVMIIAIIIAVGVMMLAAQSIGEFVENNPTIKMLALSFLILVGTALLGEGMHFHIPKGYIYFAMAFAVVVELLNLKMRKTSTETLKLNRKNP